MPSKRIRSKKTIAAAIANLSQTVTRSEQISTPYSLAQGAVSDGAIDQGVIYGSAFATGAISSRALGLSAYVPNGEGIQRVPAPLTDVDYWDDVVLGLIELHNSGVHNGEDIENVSATVEGILFSPTADAEARLYLTGRQSIPKSRKVYATWKSTAAVPLKIIYWTSAVTKFVDRLRIEAGVVTATTTAAHGFVTGDVVKLTECGPNFNGVYTITVPTDSTDTFTYTAASTAPTDAAEVVLAIDGKVAIESYSYVSLEDKISWEAPASATEYAVYAELPAGSEARTLTEARVFELIGSGTNQTTSFAISNKSITSNIATLTTTTDHTFKVDDYVEITNIYDSCSTLVASFLDDNTQVFTNTPHGFESGIYVFIDWPSSSYLTAGYYYITALGSSTSFFIYTPWLSGFGFYETPVGLGTAIYYASNGTEIYTDSIFAGQAKITATTNNTFSFARTSTFGYPSTAVSPTGVGTVGKPRYCYPSYVETSVASSFIDIYTRSAHGFAAGETVGISASGDYKWMSGKYTIASATSRYFRISTTPEQTLSLFAPTNKTILAYVGSSATSVEMGPDGFRYLTKSDEGEATATDLGTTSDNFITVTRVDGVSVAAIDNQGAATFSSISTDELTVSGTNLVGAFANAKYNGVTYSGDYLNRLSRGVVYRGEFSVTNSTAVAASNFSLAYGTFQVEDGRHYLVNITTGGLRATATQNAIFELVMSTEPLRADNPGTRHLQQLLLPSVHSDLAPMTGFFTAEAVTPASNLSISSISRSTTTVTVVTSSVHGLTTGDFVGISDTSNTLFHGTFAVTVTNTVAFTYTTTSSGTITALTSGNVRKVSPLLSQAGKLPAGVPIYWALRLRHATAPTSYNLVVSGNPSGTAQMEFTIADLGQARTSTNVTQVGLTTTLMALEPTDPGGGAGGTTTTYTTTATVNASDSAYYDNYGEGTGTSDPYAYRYSLYQGNPGTSSGTKKSAVLFPTVTPPTGATNVTVTKVEVYLRNRHSYNSSGLTAYIGVHSSSSLGSSVPAATNGITRTTSSFTKGQGKWVTLSSTCHTAFKPGAQTARGVLIGLTDDDPDTWYSSLANYGYFDGNTMSDEPKLRITYTYEL